MIVAYCHDYDIASHAHIALCAERDIFDRAHD